MGVKWLAEMFDSISGYSLFIVSNFIRPGISGALDGEEETEMMFILQMKERIWMKKDMQQIGMKKLTHNYDILDYYSPCTLT